MSRRVVITGLGCISPYGSGITSLWAGIRQQSNIISPIPDQFTENCHFRSRYYIPLSYTEGSNSAAQSRIIQMTLQAGIEAWLDAGLPEKLSQKASLDTGISLGTGISSFHDAFHSWDAHTRGKNSSHRFHRMILLRVMPNAPASWLSQQMGISGPVQTINTACASGSYGIGSGYEKIKAGVTSIMLAGGIEDLGDPSGSFMRAFDGLGTLTSSKDGLPRPFSSQRSGFLFSEGGAYILVLEELEHARKRGARIYAELLNSATATLGGSMVAVDPDDTVAQSILSAITRKYPIDYYNAHGTGTVQNDRFEEHLLKTVFPSRSPIINVSKSLLGHSIGASSGCETILTALSLYHGIIPADITEDFSDQLNICTEETQKEIEFAINASFGFGGHLSFLTLGKYHD